MRSSIAHFKLNPAKPSRGCERVAGLYLTGHVSCLAGSVAGANSLILREMLALGIRQTFFSKPSFVDPRAAIADILPCECFEFVDTTNLLPDWLRRTFVSSRFNLLGQLLFRFDHCTYVAKILHTMRVHGASESADAIVWLGTWAAGRVDGVSTVSFAQGPPGTDARSVSKHRELIIRLAGAWHYRKLSVYSAWRMSRGLPKFEHSDAVIVGSQWSRGVLSERFGLEASSVHACPYPIDLELFSPPAAFRNADGPLRVLWLGRFVPRKRLDVLLDGAAEAIRQGVDLELTIVGTSGFVPNYERLICEFAYRERVRLIPGMSRAEVPALMHRMDVLAQPSDDENFGSSVAEAMACGIPTIVGATNGTADYICKRSIQLSDDRPETMASALSMMADAKRAGALADPQPTRRVAEKNFAPRVVTSRLLDILQQTIRGQAQ